MKIVYALHKTRNGWLVGKSEYIYSDDLPECHSFETMKSLTEYLLSSVGEAKTKDEKKPAKKGK